ncbi:hypothetical protein ACLBXM_09445 [Xanthobacteraceae bacterium A53D]
MSRFLFATLCCLLGLAALPSSASAVPPEAPLLLVSDPAALQAAEAAGAGFARWFSPTQMPPGGDGIVPNDRLSREPAWQSIVQPIQASISRIAREDSRAGVGVARYSHRLFDTRWLNAATAFFELVGVVNRLDRRPFHADACGETRLIYRLAYTGSTGRSRLPMTMAVELRGEPRDSDGSCRSAAALWRAPAGYEGAALGRWLVSTDGPLSPARLERARLVQIAVNLQSVRWPSGVKPDLGGHAEYILRAYGWQEAQGRYVPRGLENTPDVARLRGDAASRAALLEWLRQAEAMKALDSGTLQIPDRFLAREAVSVAPLGSARRANQPFSQIYDPEIWEAVPGSRTLQSPGAVLRRLDDLTCSGCHQSRSVAGFHLLGIDRAGATRTYGAGNALALPGSPHLQDELARRAIYTLASASQTEPDPFRPLAGAGSAEGGFGAACGLNDDPGVAGWGCAAGLTCRPHGSRGADDPIGVCMPQAPQVGALCEPARLRSVVDPRKDAAFPQGRIDCGASAHCERTSVGFPGGMCSGACDPDDPEAVCGSIAILDGFNRCLAARQPFDACLRQHTRPGSQRACSADRPCREDYICAEAGTQPGSGACIPPYFLFQMRVDGHP